MFIKHEDKIAKDQSLHHMLKQVCVIRALEKAVINGHLPSRNLRSNRGHRQRQQDRNAVNTKILRSIWSHNIMK